MSTWEERLAGASICEPRRTFDVAEGLRRVALEAGYLPTAAPARPEVARARRRLGVVAGWSVTGTGAAAHMKKLTDILDAPDPAFTNWADGDLDLDGLFVFACSLYLARHPESARFWWQAAASAGHAAAAYCLYLQHLMAGDTGLADHWRQQINANLNHPHGSDLHVDEQSILVEVLGWFAGYSARNRPRRPVPVGGLQKEFERLAESHDDDRLLCRPDRHLAERLQELTSSCTNPAEGSPPGPPPGPGGLPSAFPHKEGHLTVDTPTPAPDHPHPRTRRPRHLAALRHFVHGLSYGTGLTLAGLLGYWIQHLL
ncbi:hypothetical protein [Streptomyces sp. NPDC001770]